MLWQEIAFVVLMALATIRAITTSVRKVIESKGLDLTWEQELILKEDTEHWWTACAINTLALSIGIFVLFGPREIDITPTWQEAYLGYAYVVFSVLILTRIERHGFYFRKRNGINIWGNPTQEARERAAAAKQMDEVQEVVEDTNRMIYEDRARSDSDRAQGDVDRGEEQTDRKEGRDHRGYNSGKSESEDDKT